MENVSDGSPRVDIHLSVNPEFELRLDSLSVAESASSATDFAGNEIEVGHAKFTIFSEAGEIATGALLFVEYTRDHPAAWRLVVVPRPALEPLAGSMEKLVMAEGGEAIEKRAEAGRKVFDSGPSK